MERSKAEEISNVFRKLQSVELNLTALEIGKDNKRVISTYGLTYEEIKDAVNRKLEKLNMELTNLI